MANPQVLLDYCLTRPGDDYAIAAGVPIFNITHGPVLIKYLVGIFTANETTGASTLDFDINGAGVSGGPSGGLGAALIDDQVLCFMDGATACLFSGAGIPASIVTPATPTCHVIAGPGSITIDVAVAKIDGIAFYVVYQRLTSASRIVLA
jgi:hypothetical protein